MAREVPPPCGLPSVQLSLVSIADTTWNGVPRRTHKSSPLQLVSAMAAGSKSMESLGFQKRAPGSL